MARSHRFRSFFDNGSPVFLPMLLEVGQPKLFDRDRRVNGRSGVLTLLARARLPLIDGVLPRRELLFGLRLRRELTEHEPMPFVCGIPRMFALAPFLPAMGAPFRQTAQRQERFRTFRDHVPVVCGSLGGFDLLAARCANENRSCRHVRTSRNCCRVAAQSGSHMDTWSVAVEAPSLPTGSAMVIR
jgi:hypothetical protein